jgi:catechol 2,3-dioxygenase-like lactoylglutathione lyase family enzyme
MAKFDRTVEDMGNIVMLEHVNTRVPDQQLAVTFYLMGLGLTRDPYLMAGTNNMWINIGKSQFHLPTNPQPQVLRGHTGLIVPDRKALLARLESVKDALAGTQFAVKQHKKYVEVTCPWGNRIRCYEPGEDFGAMRLGMPYVEIDAPVGTADGIVRFYKKIMKTDATVKKGKDGNRAVVSVGDGQQLVFRETAEPQPDYDGHHIAIYVADFSGPHKKLQEMGLVSEESDQHQYRFLDIVDPDDGRPLLRIEHEVRSMRHPMYARPLVNRDPRINNRNYVPGYEAQVFAEAPTL